MAIGVFGLKKVYKRQVENINNGNFNSWVEDYSHSYIMGGKTLPSGSPQATLIRFNFIDELSQQLPTQLPAASGQSYNATIRNYNYAFVSGGTNNASSTIARLDFSTELFSLPGTVLPANTSNHSAVSRVDEGYGYFVGGQSGPTILNTITRFDFTNETKSTTVNLPTAITDLGAFNGTTYGYAGGGTPPLVNASSTIYRLDFSSGSLSIPASTLNFTTERYGFVAAENNSYGYAAAGRNLSSTISTIDKLDFSSETISKLSAVTSNAGVDGGGYNSLSCGYFAGINQNTTIDRLDFSNESITSSIAAYMSPQTRGIFSSASVRHKRYSTNVGTYQYCNGGSNNSKIDKLSFQTGTWTANVANAPNNQAQTQGASSNDYGYFFGGNKGAGQTSEITRLDFTTDNLITLGPKDKTKNLALVLPSTASLTDQATTQTNSYAYIAGGNNPPTSAVLRMDFSTENITQEAQFPVNVQSFVTTKSPTNAYFTMSNGVCTCYRLNFSSETISTISNNYPFASANGNGTASSKGPAYGYFMGGKDPTRSPNTVTSVHRFDFSAETFSLIPTKFTWNSQGGFSYNNIFAYFNNFGSNASVQKMDFGTETITTEANSPSTRVDSAAYTNTNN